MEKEFKKTKITTETNNQDIFACKHTFICACEECGKVGPLHVHVHAPKNIFTYEAYKGMKPIHVHVHTEFIEIKDD